MFAGDEYSPAPPVREVHHVLTKQSPTAITIMKILQSRTYITINHHYYTQLLLQSTTVITINNLYTDQQLLLQLTTAITDNNYYYMGNTWSMLCSNMLIMYWSLLSVSRCEMVDLSVQ